MDSNQKQKVESSSTADCIAFFFKFLNHVLITLNAFLAILMTKLFGNRRIREDLVLQQSLNDILSILPSHCPLACFQIISLPSQSVCQRFIFLRNFNSFDVSQLKGCIDRWKAHTPPAIPNASPNIILDNLSFFSLIIC